METQIEKDIEFDKLDSAINVFGNCDENIKIIEDAYNIRILSRDNGIKIIGDAENIKKADKVLRKLIEFAEKGETITRQNVNYIVQLEEDGQLEINYEDLADSICVTAKGKQIKPKTLGQKAYVKAIKDNIIVFGIGPRNRENLPCGSNGRDCFQK